ncbi:hypothetical protein SAMN05421881_10165 [Nitrosomonas halophila]|uniref:Lipoprotein n=1 Tax=Nitrosomonas halophila TaxID=44576 RepID=A0A1H3GQ21_9PROT|nr:hypothetical protein SAMN05421881_10165 [Nitrosomonas halophila]
MKRPGVIGILVPLLIVSGCGAISDADEIIFFKYRQPDELERQYLHLATYLNSAKSCFLIHPETLSVAPLNPDGSKVSFLRSSCFMHVASLSGDDAICQKVRSVSTFLYTGNMLNAKLCRELASTANPYAGRQVAGAGNLNVQKILTLAGYSESDVDTFLVAEGRFSSAERAAYYRDNEPSVFWLEVMEYVIGSRGFFNRIDILPGFASERDLEAMKNVTWRPRFQKELPLSE